MSPAGRIFRILIYLRMVETGVAAVMVGKHIMMERSVLAAPDASITMFTLRMVGILEALRKDAPLHREVLVPVERRAFVNGP